MGHKGFVSFGNTVGGFSPEEQEKLDALEKEVALELKANPAKLDQPELLRVEVVAYVKPSAAAEVGNDFLLEDGSVVYLSAVQSAPVVAELQAGHNPPPSLKKKNEEGKQAN